MRRGWWQTRDTLDTATDHITRQRLQAEPNAPWQFCFFVSLSTFNSLLLFSPPDILLLLLLAFFNFSISCQSNSWVVDLHFLNFNVWKTTHFKCLISWSANPYECWHTWSDGDLTPFLHNCFPLPPSTWHDKAKDAENHLWCVVLALHMVVVNNLQKYLSSKFKILKPRHLACANEITSGAEKPISSGSHLLTWFHFLHLV